MLSFLCSRLVILICGTLYPAYASYKAVKTKDIKEYVKWMMYWIVFALFTAAEIFLDVFLSFWFPFYYELKIVFVFWLLCPATMGSNFMYRKFVHPLLSKREKDIDEYIERCKEDGYSAFLKIGSKAVTVATNTFIETAVRQLPLAHQLGLLPVLPPPSQVDSPSKRVVRSSDMYIPSREPIRAATRVSSTPLKEGELAEPPEFLLSDDEMEMPRARSPRRAKAPVKKRARSKSRGRKATVRAK